MNSRDHTSGDYSQSLNEFVLAEIPENATCLDVGCWTGNLGKELIKRKNCVVDGIDNKKDVLKKAMQNGYRKTYLVDLNNTTKNFGIKKKYQIIVFADVLEHVMNPERVLAILKQNLDHNGKIIISLPNVAFALNRVELLMGKWEYKDFGTLDRTHIRFFTIQTGEGMVKAAGLTVRKVKPYNQFGLLRYLNIFTTLLPGLFAYQFLITAKSK